MCAEPEALHVAWLCLCLCGDEGVCHTPRGSYFAGWTDEEIEQGAPEGAGGGAQMDDILASMFAQRQSAAFGGGGGFGGGGFPFGAQGNRF